MKASKKKIALLIAVLLVLLLVAAVFLYGLLLLIQRGERVSHYYETTSIAREHDARLEKILPPSATEIYEEVDIDSQQIWVRFRMNNSDINRIVTGKQKLGDEEKREILNDKSSRPLVADWWFDTLQSQEAANNDGLKADVYIGKCLAVDRFSTSYTAIDRESDLVYYWCSNNDLNS